jgi:hypothetical protein
MDEDCNLLRPVITHHLLLLVTPRQGCYSLKNRPHVNHQDRDTSTAAMKKSRPYASLPHGQPRAKNVTGETLAELVEMHMPGFSKSISTVST